MSTLNVFASDKCPFLSESRFHNVGVIEHNMFSPQAAMQAQNYTRKRSAKLKGQERRLINFYCRHNNMDREA